jgi:hypothetical protein
MLKTVASLLLVTALATQGRAQSQEKPVTMRSMPQPVIGPELRLILDLAGDWDSTEMWEKVEGVSPGGKGTGKQTVRVGPGGLSVIVDYESHTGPFPDYRGHGVLSWEHDEKIYRMAWAQNVTPGISIETGGMEGENLVTSYEISEHGQKYIVRNVYSDINTTPTRSLPTTWISRGSRPRI